MLTMAVLEDGGEDKPSEWKVELSPERRASVLNESNYTNEKLHGESLLEVWKFVLKNNSYNITLEV